MTTTIVEIDLESLVVGTIASCIQHPIDVQDRTTIPSITTT
jgi:hypothetical protein